MIADIYEAILAEIQGFSDAQNIPVAWPNVDYSDKSEPFIAPDILLAQTASLGLYVVNMPGVLQISVNYQDGGGIVTPAGIIDALLLAFPRNHKILAGDYCIQFGNNGGYVSPYLISNGWIQYPVSFNFRIMYS